MYDLIAATGRWWRSVQGPKHGDCQSEGHDEGDRNVEVFAHYARLLSTDI